MVLLTWAFVLAALSVSAAAHPLPRIEPIWGYGFTNAFPLFGFDEPVSVVVAPGKPNALFILERKGRIRLIPDLSYPFLRTFLDLPNTAFKGAESGLLGLAFHPNFNANGRFFVFRTIQQDGFRCQLSEFRVSPENPNMADPRTEKVLISQRDDMDTHNAGDLKFGPDGYLYLSLGDEKPSIEDQHNSPQAIDRGLFAGIIRIDIDGRQGNLPPNPHASVFGSYRIPADNPFIGLTKFQGATVDPARVRTEFFAVGLRNPWRFTFDPVTRELICADVGAGFIEEINFIEKGGNYGWPHVEGAILWETNYSERFEPPSYQYRHGSGNFEGNVVIGGVIAESAALPVRGKYIFGDFHSGNIWALDTRARSTTPEWLTARKGIVSFAVDPRDGGVLAANLLSGTIERLVYHGPERFEIPQKLSELSLFEDLTTLAPARGLLPYEIINPLWSDGAYKQRWVSLQRAEGKIIFSATEPWRLPDGAFWVKHFELELTNGVPESRRRLETRVLVKGATGVYGLSYRWGDSLTEATLLPPYATNETFLIHDGGTVRTQVWTYPGWQQCKTCHTEAAGGALSFNTYQLNRSVVMEGVETNQLLWLAARGYFIDHSKIETSRLPSLSAMDEPFAPVEHRVRSYLFSNCAHCHQPGHRLFGPQWDGRMSTPLSKAKIINAGSFFYPHPMKIITPHDPTNSFMLVRVSNRAPWYQMPPLATSEIDPTFLQALGDWIGSFPDATWSYIDVGSHLAEGAAEQKEEVLRLSSAGSGLAAGSFRFAQRKVDGGAELVARVANLTTMAPGSEAGLMFRDALVSTGAYTAIYSSGDAISFRSRDSAGEESSASTPLGVARWLKLVRNGTKVSGWSSADGLDWKLTGEGQPELSLQVHAGLFVASGDSRGRFATAEFDSYSLDSVVLTATTRKEKPTEILMEAAASSVAMNDLSVEFFAGDQMIANVTNPPFAATMERSRIGPITLYAVLNSSHGSITSNPVLFELETPDPASWTMPSDSSTQGDWRGRYGREAFLIPGVLTNPSPHMAIEVLKGGRATTISSDDRMALELTEGRAQVLLPGNPAIELAFRSRDIHPHQGAIYLHDWLGIGPEELLFFSTDGSSFTPGQAVRCSDGVYFTFAFRGEIIVRVENPRGTAHLSGAFVDPVEDLLVEIVTPELGLAVQQPAGVVLQVNASAPGREIARVEIIEEGKVLATLDAPPFRTTLTNLYTGEHAITAVAHGMFGLVKASAPRSLTVLPPEPQVEFLGTDTQTQGNWKRRYGRAGFWIIGDSAVLPEAISITAAGVRTSVWDAEADTVRALERVEEGPRLAACLVNVPEFSVEVNVLDGRSRGLGIYFLDFDQAGRQVELELRGADGKLLDARTVERFGSGKYLFWRVRGHTSIKLWTRSSNPVLSGFFLEDDMSAYDLWRNHHFDRDELPANPESFDIADADGDGFSNALEYALGFDARLADDNPGPIWSLSSTMLVGRLSRRAPAADLEPVFEVSRDLAGWSAGTVITNRAGDLVIELPVKEEQQFVRLQVLRRR